MSVTVSFSRGTCRCTLLGRKRCFPWTRNRHHDSPQEASLRRRFSFRPLNLPEKLEIGGNNSSYMWENNLKKFLVGHYQRMKPNKSIRCCDVCQLGWDLFPNPSPPRFYRFSSFSFSSFAFVVGRVDKESFFQNEFWIDFNFFALKIRIHS